MGTIWIDYDEYDRLAFSLSRIGLRFGMMVEVRQGQRNIINTQNAAYNKAAWAFVDSERGSQC